MVLELVQVLLELELASRFVGAGIAAQRLKLGVLP